jgi:hypothetical protein
MTPTGYEALHIGRKNLEASSWDGEQNWHSLPFAQEIKAATILALLRFVGACPKLSEGTSLTKRAGFSNSSDTIDAVAVWRRIPPRVGVLKVAIDGVVVEDNGLEILYGLGVFRVLAWAFEEGSAPDGNSDSIKLEFQALEVLAKLCVFDCSP